MGGKAANTGMTLGQVDEHLKLWQARLSAVAENLLALQTDATYGSLTGTGGLDKVTVSGLTAAAVGPSLSRMNELYRQFGSLQGMLDTAQALRKGLPAMFGGENKARELEQLLFGPSINVDVPEMPLAERTLVSSAQTSTKVTPEQVLQTMTATFGGVQTVVATVGRAWTDFATRYDEVERELARLRDQTALSAAAFAPSLDELEGRLKVAHQQVRTDPMGALERLRAEVAPSLAALSRQVTRAQEVAAQLVTAGDLFRLLERVHRDHVALAAEARAKVTGDAPWPQPVPETEIEGVRAWLSRLEARRAGGSVEPVAVGVRNWSRAAEACLKEDRSAMAFLHARLAARGELRGRFEALKAKARAYGLAERDGIGELAAACEQLLYTRPVPLERAAAALARYEEQLRTPVPAGDLHGGVAAR